MNMRYWIWSATKTSWDTLRSKGVWATQHKNVTIGLKKNDINIVYVKGTSCFKGIFRAISDWYETDELVWNDEIKESKKKYPYQINWEQIQLGEANFNDLVSELKFVKNKSKPARYLYLRGMNGWPANSAKPVEESDFQIILEQMKKGKRHL